MTRKKPGRRHDPLGLPSTYQWLHEPFLAGAAEEDSWRGRHDLGAFLTMRLADRLRVDDEPPEPIAMQYQVRATEDYVQQLAPRTPDVDLMVEIVRACGVAHETGARERLWNALLALADWLDGLGWAARADDVLKTTFGVQGPQDGRSAHILLRLARRDGQTRGWEGAEHLLQAACDIAQQLQPGRRSSRRRAAPRPQGPVPASPAEALLRRTVDALAGASLPEATGEARAGLADLLSGEGRLLEASREYARAYRLTSSGRARGDALLRLGRTLVALGRPGAARRSFARLLAEEAPAASYFPALAEAIALSAAAGDRISYERLRRLIPEREPLVAAEVWQAFQRRAAEATGGRRPSRPTRRGPGRRPPPGTA